MNCRCQPGSQTFFHLAPKVSRVCLAVPTSNVPGKNTAQLGQFGDLKAAQNEAFFGFFHGSFVIYTRSSMGMP